MKKSVFLIAGGVIVVILLLLLINNEKKELQIVRDKSYFSEFSIVDKKVYIRCELIIKNSGSKDKNFKLDAVMKDDVSMGLLQKEKLQGFNLALTENEFKISKKSSSTFSVIFVGDFAGISKKHDRNLPQIIITEI